MTTLKCGVFLLVVAVFCVHVECDGSKEEKGGKYGGNYGGGHYGGGKYGGGENYGGGGGHYAVGFSTEEIASMCADKADCKNCFDGSQDVTGNARTLKVADVLQCLTQYLPNSGWVPTCVNYGNDMIQQNADNLPPSVPNMVSFCVRTSLDFTSAGKCDPKQPWKDFYTCFATPGKGKKGSHEASGESGEKGSKESGEKKGDEKRRRAAGIAIDGAIDGAAME